MAQVSRLPLVAGRSRASCPPRHSCILHVALLLALAAPAVHAQAVTKADQAHVAMGEGDAAGALVLMQQHVAEHPDDRAARLDLTRYLLWNGALAKAEKVLLADPAAADSAEGRALHAYLLASGGRLREARALDAPLLAAAPEDFQPNFSESLALMQSTRPMLAVPWIETLKRLQPGSKDIADLERRAWVRRASFVSLGYTARSSTDDISSDLPTLWGEYRVNDRLRLTGEYGYWRYGVDDGGPFEAIGGGDVHESRGLLGLRFAPNEYSELQLAFGNSHIEGDSTSLWRARGDLRFSDSFSGALLFDRDRVAASPRSLSLGLTRTGTELQLQLTPDLNWTANLWLRRDESSDDNSRYDVTVAARRAVLREPKFSLDLGGVVEKQHFDFNPGNGYYAPDNYKRYGITAHGYVGLGQETGLALHAVLGRQRDETFDSWQSANDFDATLIFGALSKWEGRITAAYTQRAQSSGAYEAVMWSAQVTRRF